MTWKVINKYSYPKSMRSIYKGSRHYDVGGDKPPRWEKQPKNDMGGK